MNKTLQTLQWLLVAVIIVATIATVESGYRWWKQNKVNQYIANPTKFAKVPDNPQAELAQAALLVQQDKKQKALNVLTQMLGEENDSNLVAKAYYNRGNINLRHAMALKPKDIKRIPLVELAKQDYRTALNLRPGLWNARYNLNVALRIAPEKPSSNGRLRKQSFGKKRVIKTRSFRVDLP